MSTHERKGQVLMGMACLVLPRCISLWYLPRPVMCAEMLPRGRVNDPARKDLATGRQLRT